MAPTATQSEATRERLIDAAGEIFAAHGFRQVTVREICDRAEANIAAVNYHFGDKRGLYEAVFRHAALCAPQAQLEGPAEVRLRGAIEALLGCVFGVGRPTWYARLMMREMMEPTEILDQVVNERIRPFCDELTAIVGELGGGRLAESDQRRAVRSLVAQCVYYQHCRAVIARLDPDQRFDADEQTRIADHVAAFTLGGIARLVSGARP